METQGSRGFFVVSPGPFGQHVADGSSRFDRSVAERIEEGGGRCLQMGPRAGSHVTSHDWRMSEERLAAGTPTGNPVRHGAEAGEGDRMGEMHDGIRTVADGVTSISRAGVNCYLVESEAGPVLIDAGLPRSWKMLEAALAAASLTPADLVAV